MRLCFGALSLSLYSRIPPGCYNQLYKQIWGFKGTYIIFTQERNFRFCLEKYLDFVTFQFFLLGLFQAIKFSSEDSLIAWKDKTISFNFHFSHLGSA